MAQRIVERHVATREFEPDHLYVNDQGMTKCGKHVGTEATYTPWAWSDVTEYVGEGEELGCEDLRCQKAIEVK